MPDHSLHGIVPALVTPFREDERIDYGAWQALIDTLIGAGVDGILTGGSSGEFYALEPEERSVTLRFCRQAVAGRVPLYANVGSITTRESIRLAQAAEEVGADAVVVITPHFIRPSQQELAEHYVEICRSVRVPVLAYNFPSHGGVEIAPGTLAQVAQRCENLAGVKDSSGQLERLAAYRDCVPGRRLAVFCGHDELLLPALDLGCAGAVAACANIAPRLFVDLYRAFREGRHADAERLQGFVTDLGRAAGLHTFPSVLKEALRIAGSPVGNCRKPVGAVPEGVKAQVASVIGRIAQQGYLLKTGKTVTA